MTDERWDWADVAAVGVLAREWSRIMPLDDAPVASRLEQLSEALDDGVWDDGCIVPRQQECAAGIRYGWEEGCGANLRVFDILCPECGALAAEAVVSEHRAMVLPMPVRSGPDGIFTYSIPDDTE